MAGRVKPIDRQSVHQICSGQVVLNLAIAVKELVENSLDAGATSVEVRLKNHGSELLEVIDNGSGVKEENFRALTLKHHTSKLNDFSDLAGVSTFGFRGEALSSLCALSNLMVTTRHTSVAIGTKLEYNHDGILVKQTPISRQPGTTVTLQNLFSTFPVRHKEFLRNVKKEFGKMIHLLQAYCLISTGVRITCTNQAGTGKKNVLAQTQHNGCIRDNISNIYGPKSLTNLLELKQSEPSLECCEEFGVKVHPENKHVFRISGHISSCAHGSGRSSADRQYYYINNRPCDFPKISKLVNDVYHMYNRHQYPMVVFNISLAKDYVDVNLTPDKRKILIQEEKTLLAVIKTSLVALFEPLSGTYQLKQPMLKTNSLLSNFKINNVEDSNEVKRSSDKPLSKLTRATISNLKRSFSHPDAEKNQPLEKASKCPKLDTFFTRLPIPSDSDSLVDVPSPIKGDIVAQNNDNDVNESINGSETTIVNSDLISPISETNHEDSQRKKNVETFNCKEPNDIHRSSYIGERTFTLKSENLNTFKELQEESSESCGTDKNLTSVSVDELNVRATMPPEDAVIETKESVTASSDSDSNITVQHENIGVELPCKDLGIENKTSFPAGRDIQRSTEHTNIDKASALVKKHVTIPFKLESLRKCHNLCTDRNKLTDENVGSFYASITPAHNSNAESELVRNISKDMFSKMEILGQFNLGFIITKLKSDLFIIDQHATDEKYNFETFQRTTTLRSQKLIQPKRLELTAVDESILMDNVEIFQKNGFDFEITEDAPPTQRVKLVSLPISKNWTFGTDDINEMIFMLADAPKTMCRPSRVRQMFASRACRGSVMIGTALNQSDMKKLVHHMGEIEQPWNCPHGRPTMRHLINLKMLPD